MPKHVVRLVRFALRVSKKTPARARVVILGTTYKGGVKDLRNSPSKEIIASLIRIGSQVVSYDPLASESFGAIRANSLEDATKDADCVVFAVDHPEFRTVDLLTLRKVMRKSPSIVDAARVVNSNFAEELGFLHLAVGCGKNLEGGLRHA